MYEGTFTIHPRVSTRPDEPADGSEGPPFLKKGVSTPFKKNLFIEPLSVPILSKVVVGRRPIKPWSKGPIEEDAALSAASADDCLSRGVISRSPMGPTR